MKAPALSDFIFTRLQSWKTAIVNKVRHAEALQKNIHTEKQFNRQMELNGEARKIKREMAELKMEMEGLKGEG